MLLYSRLRSAYRFGPAVSRGAAAHRRRYHVVDMLAELAGDPELRLDMNLMPGDIQFLRNHTILHPRSAYEDWPEIERKRHPQQVIIMPSSNVLLPSVSICTRAGGSGRRRQYPRFLPHTSNY
ncbi:MAG TPA: TauD/TfdA family dioxygenase [Methylomirabilota bacterium]|nr:TauD/TfdA family dioxygenase [Methylomirabilota bacterium]